MSARKRKHGGSRPVIRDDDKRINYDMQNRPTEDYVKSNWLAYCPMPKRERYPTLSELDGEKQD